MFIDLTRLTTHGMPVYPGDEPPSLTESVHFDEAGCVNHQLRSSMHTGTHMDGPMHMVRDGRKLSELPVDRFVGRGVLVDARGREVLDADLLEESGVAAGDVVLFWTDWDKKFGGADYFDSFPVLTGRWRKSWRQRALK
jgi:kynurenine formamidase